MSEKQKNINIILNDLYQIDPSLKEREPELIKVINELLQAKPIVELDEKFRRELREKILELAEEMQEKSKASEKISPWAISLMKQFFEPVGYAAIGAALLALVAGPYIFNQQKSKQLSLKGSFTFEVTEKEEYAFGVLALSQPAEAGKIESQNLNGRGLLAAPAADSLIKERAEAMPAEEPAAVPPAVLPIEGMSCSYIYIGDNFSIKQDKMPVFKKLKNEEASRELADYLSQTEFAGLDITKLKNIKLQHFTIAEDREFGYVIDVNLLDGELSISKNWLKWQTASEELKETLGASEMPEDSKVIAVADKFAKDYSLGLANYGEPEVVSTQGSIIEAAAEKGYFAPIVDVVYPLLIEGKAVYERNGLKAGVHINVDIREMKVSSLWGLRTQKYQSSLYPVETDTAKILDIAKKGYGWFNPESADEVLEFELGTPKAVYLRTFDYKNGQADEFLVPALAFPVVKAPKEAGYEQENIVVPLVKEMLED